MSEVLIKVNDDDYRVDGINTPLKCSSPVESGDANDAENNIIFSSKKSGHCKLVDAPPGPVTAFDFTEDGIILCFDEKRNRLVSIDTNTDERAFFIVPTFFHFDSFYWSHIISIRIDMIMALLKMHRTKMYYLVIFRLDEKNGKVIEIDRRKTRIRCDGYRVTLQRTEACCMFGFSHDKSHIDPPSVRRCSSDVERFCKQVQETRKSNSSVDSGIEVSPGLMKRLIIMTDSDVEEMEQMDEKSVGAERKTESIILKAMWNEKGKITTDIYAIGSDRLEVDLKAPTLQIDRLSRSANVKSGISTKYLSRTSLPCLSSPLYYAGNAYFIDPSNPEQVYALRTFNEPRKGVLEAVKAKLRTMIQPENISSCLQRITVNCPAGCPPSKGVVWSDACISNRCAYICVQDIHAKTFSLWKLVFEDDCADCDTTVSLSSQNSLVQSEEKDKSISESEELNDLPVDSIDHETIIHNITCNDSTDDSATTMMSDSENRLSWVKVEEAVCPLGFTLSNSSAVRMGKSNKYGCARGLRCDALQDSAEHCFALFPISTLVL